jgi:hypothetical protein
MPTFIVIKGRRIIKEVEGADLFTIKHTIEMG